MPRPRRILQYTLAILAMFSVYYAFFGGDYPVPALVRLAWDVGQREDSFSLMRTRTEELDSLRVRIETQDTAAERYARERFGLIRDGELLVRFLPAGRELD